MKPGRRGISPRGLARLAFGWAANDADRPSQAATTARDLFRAALQGWRRKETLVLLAVLMLPFLVGGIGWILMSLLDRRSAAMGPIFFLTVAPILVAGPPYLVLVIGVAFWAKNKPSHKILSLSWWLPIILGALVIPYVCGILPIMLRHANIMLIMGSYFWTAIYFFPFVCLFGYPYVLLGRHLYASCCPCPATRP